MQNSGRYRHKIEIYEKTKSKTDKSILDEYKTSYVFVKSVFADIETRVGGLLSGRPADTVMTTVTHKFTWRFKSYENVQPDKHRIKYRGKWFDVNYCQNNKFDNEDLEVFVTEKDFR